MNFKRWSTVILMTVLFLALVPLGAQAEPYFDHPHGYYGWDGPRHHGGGRHHFRRYRGPRVVREVYVAPPPVTYVAPAPILGIPYQPQPTYSPQVAPGLHGQVTFGY